LQCKQSKAELTGLEINKELHHMGHKVSNITSVINQLIGKRPQLMIQTKKEGKTRQAKKKYKVTTVGISTARDTLFGQVSE
jgi:hypothetical protein